MKKRCTARTKKNLEIWGSHLSNHSFGVQCTRAITDTNTNTCKCHKKLQYGTYLNIVLPANFIIDLDDSTYKFLKKNNLSILEYKSSNKTILQYLIDTLKTHEFPLPSYLKSDGIEHQQYILNRLNSTDLHEDINISEFDKIYNCIMRDIIYQPQIIDYIITNTISSLNNSGLKENENETENETEKNNNTDIIPENEKKVSENYLQQQQWWLKQHKVEITDYDTKQKCIFALEHNENDGSAVLLTKAKVKIGKSLPWKDASIPGEFKNNNDTIVCPYGKYYLSQIQLFGEMKHFHNLPKSDYFEYQYESKFNILQKTHEIKFM